MPRKLGWTRSLPDHRDFLRAEPPPTMELPEAVDLSPLFPSPPFDQGDFGSCVFNAGAALMQYQQLRQGFPVWMPSRLFWYFNVRRMEGTGNEDAGAQIRDAMKSLNTTGVCYEALWPYDDAHFAVDPPKDCYDVAENHQSIRYARVRQYAMHIKAELALGNPIIFGAMLYRSFESDLVAATGDVPYPGRLEEPIGGHCMLITGYERDQVIVRNSWGTGWGDKGHCRMPMDYICSTNLVDDLWTCTLLE